MKVMPSPSVLPRWPWNEKHWAVPFGKTWLPGTGKVTMMSISDAFNKKGSVVALQFFLGQLKNSWRSSVMMGKPTAGCLASMVWQIISALLAWLSFWFSSLRNLLFPHQNWRKGIILIFWLLVPQECDETAISCKNQVFQNLSSSTSPSSPSSSPSSASPSSPTSPSSPSILCC